MQKLLTTDDVAEMLGVRRWEVQKRHKTWRKKYGIDVIRVNGAKTGQIRFIPEQIERMILKQWRTEDDPQ